jgi:DNA modification methylase
MRIEELENCTLYNGDCIEVMAELQADSINSVITDPPYEAEAHTKGRRLLSKQTGGKRTVEYGALDFDKITNKQRDQASIEMVRVCKGWLLCFCQAEAVQAWRECHEAADAKYKRAMVWVKTDGAPQFTGDRPGMGYESIVASWCNGGRSKWNGGGKHGVFIIPGRDNNFKKEHQTQKPIRLMNELVSLFSRPGDLVLDPFMGSGTTGVASLDQGRRFIGIELNEKYFDVACKRIERESKQQRMFA